MNELISLWTNLENESEKGLDTRLYKDTNQYINVYCTCKNPQKLKGIAFSFNRNISVDITGFKALENITVLMMPDYLMPSKQVLILQLNNNDKRLLDIFAIICNNIIGVIDESISSEWDVKKLLSQLHRWLNIFKQSHINKLSVTTQQGLLGELLFLKQLYDEGVPYEVGLQDWVGVEGANQDFQNKHWAAEIKTTSVSNLLTIEIHGTKQLDDKLFDMLFLCHVSVVISNNNGITLPSLVAEMRNRLSNDVGLLNIFNSKLLAIGYFDIDEEEYQKRHYHDIQYTAYKIEGDFPRIVSSDIKDGIEFVNYQISISACNPYKLMMKQMITLIKKSYGIE